MRFDLVISARGLAQEVILLENEKPQEYYFEWENRPSIVGNIYRGVVEKVVPAINAAFIDIGLEKNGFLFGKDIIEEWLEYADLFGLPEKVKRGGKIKNISYILREGQSVLVKVQRGEISTKGPKLTTFISIPGNFTILIPFLNFIGISRKIEDKKERERLRAIAEKAVETTGKGIIIRTLAEKKSENQILLDYLNLNYIWEEIEKHKSRTNAPELLYKEPPLYIKILRDFLSYPFQYIWVDEREAFLKVEELIKRTNPKLLRSLKFYEKARNIKEELNIKKDVETIFKNKIWLKNGGHIIINQTEALCSIDVNSGKSIKMDNIEETALKTNLEAIKEIVRQIRLRDLGGLIVIDFIDMGSKKYRATLMENFQKELKRDRSPHRYLRLSEFGLLEMTRKRLFQQIEQFTQTPCPFCDGEGKIKNSYKICQEIFDTVLERYNPFKEIKVKIYCHKDIKNTLEEEVWQRAFSKIKVKLKIKEDKSLKFDEYKII